MSDKALQIAREHILGPSGLDENHLVSLLGKLSGPDIDYSDLYFQHSRHESWVLEDGIVKEGTQSIDQGVGVRAVSGEKTGFAYSDEILLPALTQASAAARAIARSGGSGQVQAWRRKSTQELYQPIDPVDSLDDLAGDDERACPVGGQQKDEEVDIGVAELGEPEERLRAGYGLLDVLDHVVGDLQHDLLYLGQIGLVANTAVDHHVH